MQLPNYGTDYSIVQPDFCSHQIPSGYNMAMEENANYCATASPSGFQYTEHVQLGRLFDSKPFHQYLATFPNVYNCDEPNFYSTSVEMEPDMHGISLMGSSYRQLSFRICKELQLEEVFMLEQVSRGLFAVALQLPSILHATLHKMTLYNHLALKFNILREFNLAWFEEASCLSISLPL